jgi:hypothetical protein
MGTNITPHPIPTILEHIRQLSVVIGPRGSTTQGERRGAEYCQSIFKKLGLAPVMETFSSAASIFDPHLFAALFMLVSFAVYPLGGQWTAGLAALIALTSLASELLELGFKDNLFRRMVKKNPSQNVFSVISPAGEHRQDLVLIGHVDTQHTPLIFRTPTWVKVYQNFTTVAFILFLVQVLLYILGTLFQWDWIWYASIPSAVGAVILAAICIEANASPFTAGANDNASAVGMVLGLAEMIQAHPLQHTRVFAVCTGCEEDQHFGGIDFFTRHRAEMHSPKGLVFEMLGCAGPGWLTQEGIIIPFYSDPGMLNLVQRLSNVHPEWGAYPVKITGGNTEMADCVRYKVPALTLFGMTRNGEAPYWHQVGDTFDKMNPEVLARTYALTWAMIQEIDQ